MKSRQKNRIRPIEAIRAFSKVVRDPDDTESGVRFVLALQGNAGEKTFRRFKVEPEGAKILAERRQLIDRLRDREWLASLPKGSFGRAYLEFVQTEDLSADGLREIVEKADESYRQLDAEHRLLHDRVRDMHDLWHVLTGYGRDLVGESLLLYFSWKQLKTRAFMVVIPITYFVNELRYPGFRALAREALRRGGAAVWLPAQDWETLLTRPIDEVRETTGVGSPPIYTPDRSERAPQLAVSAGGLQ